MSSPDRRAVQAFLESTRPAGCARLNGQLPDDPEIVTRVSERDSKIIGYAQLVERDDVFTLDCVSDRPETREHLVTSLAPQHGDLTWWGHELASDEALANALHMPPPHRRLLHMSRSLPLEPELAGSADGVQLRPFVVGKDEPVWLAVNNAAFGWHTEQGDWDLATLRSRMNEPWFDPAGFLLHERDGRLAAFCWTKVHPHGRDGGTTGEIYVIAVHPDFHGLGLGRALTVAGLQWLAASGSNFAMLYVEADNTSAVRLYDSLGFRTTHVDVAYHRPAAVRSRTGDNR